jgi:hypothetical protein
LIILKAAMQIMCKNEKALANTCWIMLKNWKKKFDGRKIFYWQKSHSLKKMLRKKYPSN